MMVKFAFYLFIVPECHIEGPLRLFSCSDFVPESVEDAQGRVFVVDGAAAVDNAEVVAIAWIE